MYLPWRDLTMFLRNGIPACAKRLRGRIKPLPEAAPPTPRLVFRVGVTGHLTVPDPGVSRTVLQAVLCAIMAETKKLAPEFAAALPHRPPTAEPELRLLAQLAAGVDQLAADVAMKCGYRIQAVLPFHRDVFEVDIAKSAGGEAARAEFVRIADDKAVEAVFELPGDAASPESRDMAYAEANRVILNQVDLLVVMAKSDARSRYGGSVWLQEIASEQRIPVIRIPLDDPHKAELKWSVRGERTQQSLFRNDPAQLDSVLIHGLLEGIVTTPVQQSVSRTLASAYLAGTKRRDDWDHWGKDSTERWAVTSDDRMMIEPLGDNPERIDASFCGPYCWADFLARGYAEISRGLAVLTSLLGLIAVAAAVLTVPLESVGSWLKIPEIAVITAVLWLYGHEQKMRWRVRWLNYRQLAEQLRHARYLLLLGRTIRVDVPAHMQEFYDEAHWVNWYVRALLRQASLPHARLDRDYLEAVRWLLATRQVGSQHRFFEDAHLKQEAANVHLEKLVGGLAWVLLTAIVLYEGIHLWGAAKDVTPWIMVLGAFLPACAAALSAIKSNGEYAQNALRYRGMASALDGVMRELSGDRCLLASDLTLGYYRIANLAATATAYLLEEVYQWRTILQMKVLERA